LLFAQHQAKLDVVDKNGESLRETLEAVERQTGRRPTDLNGPELPPVMVDVWRWFRWLSKLAPFDSINGKRQPVPETEVEAFFRLRRIVPEVWQLELIRNLDVIYRNPDIDLSALSDVED
jgi:hypothetical protein